MGSVGPNILILLLVESIWRRSVSKATLPLIVVASLEPATVNLPAVPRSPWILKLPDVEIPPVVLNTPLTVKFCAVVVPRFTVPVVAERLPLTVKKSSRSKLSAVIAPVLAILTKFCNVALPIVITPFWP